MAEVYVTLTDDVRMLLDSLGRNIGETVDKALRAGGEVQRAEVDTRLRGVIRKDAKHRRRQSGQLLAALYVTEPETTSKDERRVRVTFREDRSNGTKNALIANVMERGKKGTHGGQAPRPFLAPAKIAAKDRVEKAMADVIDDEIMRRML